LLTNELHPAQAQAAQSHLILEFRKERLYLFSLPLALVNSGVLANSRARCRADSLM